MRLTTADVVRIRALYASGERQVDIAARFGVNQSCVSQVVNGKRRGADAAVVIRIRRVGPLVVCRGER